MMKVPVMLLLSVELAMALIWSLSLLIFGFQLVYIEGCLVKIENETRWHFMLLGNRNCHEDTQVELRF